MYQPEEEVFLENDRVRLEPLNWEHFYQLLPIAIDHPDLLFYSPSKFGDEESLTLYFDKAFDGKESGSRYPFAIYDKKNNEYAGSTSYMNISSYHQRVEIGSTWLARKYHRTGLNRNMKYLMLDYAFREKGVHRIELKTDARNQQSRQAIEQLGASYEGLLRQHTLMTDGHRRDTVYYSILAHEWPEISKSDVFKNVDKKILVLS